MGSKIEITKNDYAVTKRCTKVAGTYTNTFIAALKIGVI